VLIETSIRKQLRLKAHTVTQVEETGTRMLVHIDGLGKRLSRCGVCRQRCREVHDIRTEREWRDLAMRKLPLKPRTARSSGWNVPAAECVLARELSWRGSSGACAGGEPGALDIPATTQAGALLRIKTVGLSSNRRVSY